MSLFGTLNGRLGKDAEVVTTSNGNKFVKMAVATDEYVGKERKPYWYNVTINHDVVKNMLPHLTKGRAVTVQGTTYSDLYTSSNGTTGIDRVFRANFIEFLNLGSKDNNAEAKANNGTKSDSANASMSTGGLHTNTKEVASSASSSTKDADDDLPF